MPKLQVKKAGEVPPPSLAPKAAQEQQRLYEGFVGQVTAGSVGELELAQGETSRGVKTRLSRAAKRLGVALQVWDTDGHVYFRPRGAETVRRRGRPGKR